MTSEAEKHVWEDGDDLVVALDVPGGPREYVVLDVSAETGLWVQSLTEKTRKAKRRIDAGEAAEDVDADLHLSDEEESRLYERLLASTLEDLKADGVGWKKTKLLGQIAYAWVVADVDAARKVWEAGGSAPKPNRAQRRATAASGSRTKAGTGAASRTSTASTRGTSRRS